jgi:hypothetical protein
MAQEQMTDGTTVMTKFKKTFWLGLALWLVWSSSIFAASVAPSGNTVIAATSAKINAQAVLTTRQVVIKEADRERTDIPATSCTYSRFPCSVVDYLSIIVKGKPISVPRSVYLDLADINTAVVITEKGKHILRLTGGDASESYRVVIEFDANRVRTKRVYSGEGNGLLQETVYHLFEIK